MSDISPSQLRALVIAHQGLTANPQWSGKNGTADAINHLSYVQIDSINVVQRAHHHSLWSRVSDYHPEYLHQLQCERKVFEYWSHAAAYLPIEDFRFALVRMRQIAEGDKHWFDKDHKLSQEVLARIRAEGPLTAADFEHKGKQGPWWDWKPAKKALEQLFMEGELMVSERRNFQKVYDLTERVLPNHIDTNLPDKHEFARYLITSYLQAHGVGTLKQMTYLRKGDARRQVKQIIQQMIEAGELQPMDCLGQEYLALTNDANFAHSPPAKGVKLLSPFDNLVIQRERLKHIFDFDYQIECYVPKPKRQYGYFSLPILWRNEFIGRVDVKADRPAKQLLLQHLALEQQTQVGDELIQALRLAFSEYAAFNDCERYKVVSTNGKGLLRPLNKKT